MKDSSMTIVRSAKRFFSGTALSRLSGLGRDLAMAYAFGTDSAIAAFMVAYRFAHLLRRMFGEGALQTAFVPFFEGLKKESQERALTFFRDLSLTMMLFLSAIVIIGIFTIEITCRYFLIDNATSYLLYLTKLMLPSLIVICLYGLNMAFLQCYGSYFTASAAPIAFNLSWIIGVFFIAKMPSDEAMRFLSLVVVIACTFQWLMTWPRIFDIIKQNAHPFDILFWLNGRPFSKDVRALFYPFAFSLIGVGASQINSACDAIFARYAEPQGPAFLWYSIRLQQLPLALFGIAIAGALLPPLSRSAKMENWEAFKEFISTGINKTLMLMVPISIFLIIMSDPIVTVIYGHGNFDSQSISGTAACLVGYSLGLVPMSLILIVAGAFYAKDNYAIPMRAALIAILINALLNVFFVLGLHLGAFSIALSTSMSAFVNLALLIKYAYKHYPEFIPKRLM